MKRVATILVIALFFLALLAALLFKLFTPKRENSSAPVQFPIATASTESTAQDPVQFVQGFYSWYLLNFSKDPLFPHPEDRDQELAPWLSSQFLADWDQIQQEDEVNPVLLTAEDPWTWGEGISAMLLSQSIRTRRIYVTIGLGTKMHAYNVDLVQTPEGGWKIDGVASAL